MKTTPLAILLLLGLLAPGVTWSQDDSDHPEKAVCTVCAGRSTHGTDPEAEDVAGWSTHEGKHYYFCSEACKAEFDASPDWWVPMDLPHALPPLQVRTVTEDGIGEVVPLRVGEGELTILDFWATWCQPCRKTMRELQRRYESGTEGLRIVGVSIDEGEDAQKKVRKYIRNQKIRYPIVLDDQESTVWTALKVRAVPTIMLVDRVGQVIWRYTGPDGDDHLDEVLRTLPAR